MKQITNWGKATCFDTEGDGLLDAITKFHVLSYHTHDGKRGSIKGSDIEAFKRFFTYHIENKIPVVCHNVIDYDIPAVEVLLGMDLSELMAIDTLYLSYYLNVNREKHGLDSFFDDYGIKKPPVDDWVGLSYEVYRHRCVEDVKIQHALWEDLKGRLIDMSTHTKQAIDDGLVGGKRMSEDEVTYLDQFVGASTVEEYVDRTLTFLMFKADTARLREKTKFLLDVPHIDRKIEEFEGHIQEAKGILESVMPDVPKYTDKKKPAKPYKKAPKNTTEKVYIVEGERMILSASALKWNEVMANKDKTDEFGNPLVKILEGDGTKVKVLKSLVPPNAGSSSQLKAWLFSHGWKPQTFDFKDDEPAIKAWKENGFHGKKPEKRKIPQISREGDDGKELCPSVIALADEVPEVMHYQKYTTIKHRLDTFKGFKKNMDEDGYIQCGVGGLTNTLREKHRKVVNLPGVHKPYGEDIRGSFIAGEGKVALGSDLSSLEDRSKHHFMLPHDPEYVKTMMADNYDPHILTAFSADLITKKTFDDFMAGIKSEDAVNARRAGKSCLPIDNTEVLTTEGWARFGDVKVGCEVLSMNTETKLVEPCKVLDTVQFSSQKIVEMKTKSWSIESTSDHRWFIEQTTGRGDTKRQYDCYRTTDELVTNSRIYSSGRYVGGNGPTRPEEARVIGWLLSDGYTRVSEFSGKTAQGFDGRRQQFKCSISQSDKKFLAEIEADLLACGLDYGKHLNSNSEDVYILNLRSDQIRNLFDRIGLERAGKHDLDYTEWVLSLSPECLEGFFDAFWKGDGLTSKRALKYKTKTVYQKQGTICDAVQLCSELLGRNTYRNDTEKYCILSSRESGMLGMQKTTKSVGRTADVFCLTTENGNFIVRQGGFITVTGNCNYASTYNAQPPTIARSAGVSLELGKKLFDGYWKLNWSVKAIAAEQYVFTCEKGLKWLVNPVNGMCYSLRKESDRFSTLNQGTGSFFFDMWVDNVLTAMEERYGTKSLSLLMHDELVIVLKDSERFKAEMEEIVLLAIDKVNETFKLRRKLGCDVEFGQTYADIH